MHARAVSSSEPSLARLGLFIIALLPHYRRSVFGSHRSGTLYLFDAKARPQKNEFRPEQDNTTHARRSISRQDCGNSSPSSSLGLAQISARAAPRWHGGRHRVLLVGKGAVNVWAPATPHRSDSWKRHAEDTTGSAGRVRVFRAYTLCDSGFVFRSSFRGVAPVRGLRGPAHSQLQVPGFCPPFPFPSLVTKRHHTDADTYTHVKTGENVRRVGQDREDFPLRRS